MTLRLPILASLNLLLLLSLAASAQTADDFFNGGAQLYISNNIPAALAKTESGLKLYPNDVKLKKLEELLKQQQKSQGQSQQNQQQQNQQNQQSQKNQSQQKQSQQQKNQNSQAQNQQQQNQQKQNRENQQSEKQNSQQQAQSQEKTGEGKNQPANAQAMTPQEAKQLLNAQKGDEQVLQLKPKGKPENPNQPVKDW